MSKKFIKMTEKSLSTLASNSWAQIVKEQRGTFFRERTVQIFQRVASYSGHLAQAESLILVP